MWQKINLALAFVGLLLIAGPVLATGTAFTFGNPIAATNVEDAAESVINWAEGAVVMVSVLLIVFGGILYITSAGDPKQTDQGKKAITGAAIGLAIVITARSFVKTVYEIVGATPGAAAATATPFSTIVVNTLNFLLGIAGTLAVLMLVYCGITYFTAAVDSKQADTAKKIIMYSVIGVIVILLSLTIVTQIGSALTSGT